MQIEKEIESVKKPVRNKRRINLFRKRKKTDIRPFVLAKKQRTHKKLLIYILFALIALFIAIVVLVTFRYIVVPALFFKNQNIITPIGKPPVNIVDVKRKVAERKMEAKDIKINSDSELIFTFKNNVIVYLSLQKSIESQLDLIEAIDRQMIQDGKQAISIDLRYNKPIVNF